MDIDSEQLRLYHLLLQRDGATEPEIAAAMSTSESRVAELLRTLELADLAIRVGEPDGAARGWTAQAPDDATDSGIAAEMERLAALRSQYRIQRQLTEMYWRVRPGTRYEGVEVIYDQVVVLETLERLQASARTQVRAFDRPPYYSATRPERMQAQLQAQLDAMRNGVAYRVIYEPDTWENAANTDQALTGIAEGEQARQLRELPMKMLLIDDHRAVMPLDPAHHSETATLVVHPSGLLRALAEIFEFYWTRATPVGATVTSDELPERARAILTLLAAGSNDDNIARRLNLSRSTVTRILAELQQRLDASTRFQLGAQAARRGLI